LSAGKIIRKKKKNTTNSRGIGKDPNPPTKIPKKKAKKKGAECQEGKGTTVLF